MQIVIHQSRPPQTSWLKFIPLTNVAAKQQHNTTLLFNILLNTNTIYGFFVFIQNYCFHTTRLKFIQLTGTLSGKCVADYHVRCSKSLPFFRIPFWCGRPSCNFNEMNCFLTGEHYSLRTPHGFSIHSLVCSATK